MSIHLDHISYNQKNGRKHVISNIAGSKCIEAKKMRESNRLNMATTHTQVQFKFPTIVRGQHTLDPLQFNIKRMNTNI